MVLVILISFFRYKVLDVDSIGGLDARGFVLGPPIALALGKPFFMLRKPGKMPNCLFSKPYKVIFESSLISKLFVEVL